MREGEKAFMLVYKLFCVFKSRLRMRMRKIVNGPRWSSDLIVFLHGNGRHTRNLDRLQRINSLSGEKQKERAITRKMKTIA